MSENDRFLPKIRQNIIFGRTSSFFDFSEKRKKTTPDFFDEKSKTGLGFEIGQPQRKCQRRPTLQSMANPAVYSAISVVLTMKLWPMESVGIVVDGREAIISKIVENYL